MNLNPSTYKKNESLGTKIFSPQNFKADLSPNPLSQLNSYQNKECPIVDNTIPFRDLSSVSSKKQSIHDLISKLDVTRSIRYQRTVDDTYCNVYSYDYCYFNQVYLPTVWWTAAAIDDLKKGISVNAIFNDTVERIYSSAIHDWFLEWGGNFGWKQITTLDELQNMVNENGGVGIICAKRKQVGLSGHIVPVVPETDTLKATRLNGKVIYPLQSQAGKANYNYFSDIRENWWENEIYSSFVLFYHN